MANRCIRSFMLTLVMPCTIAANVGVLSSWFVAVGHAQGVVVANPERHPESQRVTVNVDDVPLISVLYTIAHDAGLVPLFSQTILPASKRVTLHLQGVMVADAFQRALRGTGLVANVHPAGDVTIFRDAAVIPMEGVIAGKVIDARTQRPLSGVTVTLDEATKVTTESNGFFRLGGVAAGSHRVTVRLLGYSRYVQTVNVTDGPATTLEIVLWPSTQTLDQVVVTGTIIPTELKAVPNAITVITAKQIEERGITHIDQLFRGEVPGVSVLNMGTANVNGSDDGNPLGEVTMFSRGATAISSSSAGTNNYTNPIKTYLDGVELADPKYLSQIDPKSIERIEILTGPQASTIYGSNAINGVMQIFTKRGQTSRPQLLFDVNTGVTQNNFSTALAPAHRGAVGVSGTEGAWSYNLGSSVSYTGSWTPGIQNTALSGYGGARAQVGPVTADVSSRIQQTQNLQRGYFKQALIAQIQDGYYLATAFSGSARSGRVAPQRATLNGQTVAVSLAYRPTSWWSHTFGLGVDQSNTDAVTTGIGYVIVSDTLLTLNQTQNARASQQYTTTVNAHVAPQTQLTLTSGVDHWTTHSSSLSARTLSLTGSLGTPSITRLRPGKNAGGFAQAQVGMLDALFLTYGVRMEKNPNYGDKVRTFPGRYGIAYTQSKGALTAKLRGSYGRSTRPPAEDEKLPYAAPYDPTAMSAFGNYDIQLGNPDLGPEYQQGGEGGLELYFGNRSSLVVTRYNQTVDNLITQAQAIDSVRSLTQYPVDIFDLFGSCGIYGGGDGPYCYAQQSKYLNAASIRNQGWELRGTMSFGPWNTTGTYSWTKSRVIGITPRYRSLFNPINYYDFQPGYTFQRVPEHTWAINVGYSAERNSVSVAIDGMGSIPGRGGDALRWTASTARRLRANASPVFVLPGSFSLPAPGYAMADVNATHRFTTRIEAKLTINNVTNYYHNDVNFQAPVSGRSTNLGVHVRL